jgi:hypothetical protein
VRREPKRELRRVNDHPQAVRARVPRRGRRGRPTPERGLPHGARVRAEHRPRAVGPLYDAFSSEIFDSPRAAELTAQARGTREFAEPLLEKAGLPTSLAGALDDTKRSPRERPQLRSFGVHRDQTGTQEDWHGGSRRLTRLR